MSCFASLPLLFLLGGSGDHATGSEASVPAARLSYDERRIAVGLFLDNPLAPATIDRSLEVLSALRCRYGLHGGVRDDEEAARRALAEVEAVEFTRRDLALMAERSGVSLAPALCGAACEQFETMVRLRLRIEALERLAAQAVCVEPRAALPQRTLSTAGLACR